TEHLDRCFVLATARGGPRHQRPQQNKQCRKYETRGDNPEPDHRRSPSSNPAPAPSSPVKSGTVRSPCPRRAPSHTHPPPKTSAGGVSHSGQVTGAKGGSSSTNIP